MSQSIAETDYSTITEITIERTRCYGSCPVYRLILRSNHQASYFGRDFVEKIGEYKGVIDPIDMQGLVTYLTEIDFFYLEDQYTDRATDGPATITTVKMGDRTKTIVHSGTDAPLSLWAFEMAIDGAGSHVIWQKVTQAK